MSVVEKAGTGERCSRSRLLEPATLGLGGLVVLGVGPQAAGNNGLLENPPSFRITSGRCTHAGCSTQPNGPLLYPIDTPS